MKLTTNEKIKLLLGRKNMTLSDLAERMGTSRQNLSNKMKRGNFSETDLEAIAAALDCDLQLLFITKDTGETI